MCGLWTILQIVAAPAKGPIGCMQASCSRMYLHLMVAIGVGKGDAHRQPVEGIHFQLGRARWPDRLEARVMAILGGGAKAKDALARRL